jgi:shikimate kinase
VSGDLSDGVGAGADNGRLPANIVLIGYRGAGKTTIGAMLAQSLGWRFVDTDDLVEAAAGLTIVEIFRQRGEQGFRTLEAEAVRQSVGRRQQVISAGGGAVHSEENRRLLRGAGLCVWLTAPADELCQRLMADPRTASTRPALTRAGGLAEIQRLLPIREPLYAATAHHTISTAGRSMADVIDEVLALPRSC